MHIFRLVPRNDLRMLSENCDVRRFQQGELLFSQGNAASNAIFLVKGRLDVLLSTKYSLRLLGQIYPGEIFGEQGLFKDNGVRGARVVAQTRGIGLQFDRNFMISNPENAAVVALEKQLIAALTRRIRNANTAIRKLWKEKQAWDQRPRQAPTNPNIYAAYADGVREQLQELMEGAR